MKILQKGFTLIELLVVIAVLGVLAAGVVIAINPAKRIKQANDTRRKSNIDQISTALAGYYTENQTFPSLAQGLAQLATTQELKSVPIPPDGGTYTYNVTPAGCAGTVASPCNDVVVYDALEVTPANAWCWKSSTGLASEVLIASCTP